MPTHHPDEAMLMDYASGALPEALSLVVATHLALCPDCRAETSRFEAVGGAILSSAPPAAIENASRERALAAIERAPRTAGRSSTKAPAARADADSGVPVLPQPLRTYAGGEPKELSWRWRGSLSECPLRLSGGFNVRLMKIRNGAAMPRHGHHGMEYTLVLAGGFSDAGGHYLRGDVAIADPAVEHKPVADTGEDCLCLAVSEGPVRFAGLAGRILGLFQQH
jgi:putative transcriptional regulator